MTVVPLKTTKQDFIFVSVSSGCPKDVAMLTRVRPRRINQRTEELKSTSAQYKCLKVVNASRAGEVNYVCLEVQLFPPCPSLITALLCPCKSNVRVFVHNRKTHIVFVFGVTQS